MNVDIWPNLISTQDFNCIAAKSLPNKHVDNYVKSHSWGKSTDGCRSYIVYLEIVVNTYNDTDTLSQYTKHNIVVNYLPSSLQKFICSGQIDLSNLKSGLYLIRFTSENGVEQRRVEVSK